MNKKNQEIDLTTGSVPKLLRQLFIPASIGLFFSVLYNVVDTYFSGQISSQALTALSVTFPIFFLIVAFSVGFSAGASALIATKIGAKKKEEAKKFYCQFLCFGLFLAICLTSTGLIVSKPMLIFLGVKEDYLKDALAYILPIFSGSIFILFTFVINSGLNALGQNKPQRNYLIFAFFANIILDYWFIKGGLGIPALGIKGIAYATILVHIFGIIYLLVCVKKTFLLETIDFKCLSYFIPRKDCFRTILFQGIPTTISMLSVSFYFFVLNKFISIFGTDAIAAYGIGLRIEQLILVPGIGIGIAISTLVAQNHGAMLKSRVRESIRAGVLYSFCVMATGCFFLLFAGKLMLSFFTQKPEIIAIGWEYLRIEAFTLFSYVLIHTSSSILQGLKKPNISTFINIFGRILPIPILYIAIYKLGFGSQAVWWTILATCYFMGIVFVILTKREIRKTFPKDSDIF